MKISRITFFIFLYDFIFLSTFLKKQLQVSSYSAECSLPFSGHTDAVNSIVNIKAANYQDIIGIF